MRPPPVRLVAACLLAAGCGACGGSGGPTGHPSRGGEASLSRTLASAEIYDPATGRFVATGAMSGARTSHTAALLADGRVLVAGGHRGRRAALRVLRSAEVFDRATGAFASTGPLRARRHSTTP